MVFLTTNYLNQAISQLKSKKYYYYAISPMKAIIEMIQGGNKVNELTIISAGMFSVAEEIFSVRK